MSVTNPTRQVGLGEVLKAWFDGSRAVYPRDVIYPPDSRPQDVEQQSSVEMVSSQDTAIAAALTELGYTLPLQIEVLAVTKGSPADGRLAHPRPASSASTARRIRDVDAGVEGDRGGRRRRPATFVVRRDGDASRSP